MDVSGIFSRPARRALLLAGIAFAALLPSLAQAQQRPPASAQPAATPTAVAVQPGQRLNQEQLAQLVAPVALYPDTLLTQILVASTYPIEIVQAQRWLSQGQNGSLRGDAMEQALRLQ